MDPLQLVMNERIRQDSKWGVQNHDDLYWLGILMEEVGEASKNLIEHADPEVTDKELVQVTAVALAWLECRARNRRRVVTVGTLTFHDPVTDTYWPAGNPQGEPAITIADYKGVDGKVFHIAYTKRQVESRPLFQPYIPLANGTAINGPVWYSRPL